MPYAYCCNKLQKGAMAHNLVDPVISEYFSKLGKRGGDKNAAKGKEYFSAIGKIGGSRKKKDKDEKKDE